MKKFLLKSLVGLSLLQVAAPAQAGLFSDIGSWFTRTVASLRTSWNSSSTSTKATIGTAGVGALTLGGYLWNKHAKAEQKKAEEDAKHKKEIREAADNYVMKQEVKQAEQEAAAKEKAEGEAARKKAEEEEAKRKEAEEEEAARKKTEEERKEEAERLEQEKLQREQEAKKAQEEARLKAEQEARKKAEEEAKQKKAEEEAAPKETEEVCLLKITEERPSFDRWSKAMRQFPLSKNLTQENIKNGIGTALTQEQLKNEIKRHINTWQLPADKFLGDGFEKDFLFKKRAEEFKPFVEKLVLNPGDQVAFHGDFHGDVHSLLNFVEYLQKNGYMNGFKITKSNFHIILLGDYTDRGMYGAETLYTVLRLKAENPDNMHMVRGNHEDLRLNRGRAGLLGELQSKFGLEGGKILLTDINIFYDTLPAALYLGCKSDNGSVDYVQCCHGGIEVGYNPKPFLISDKTYMRITTIKDQQNGFMWNDFKYDSTHKDSYTRGRGYEHSKSTTRKYLNSNTLQAIFRAHQHVATESQDKWEKASENHNGANIMRRIYNLDVDLKKRDHEDNAGLGKLWDFENKPGSLRGTKVITFGVAPCTGYYHVPYDGWGILTLKPGYFNWYMQAIRMSATDKSLNVDVVKSGEKITADQGAWGEFLPEIEKSDDPNDIESGWLDIEDKSAHGVAKSKYKFAMDDADTKVVDKCKIYTRHFFRDEKDKKNGKIVVVGVHGTKLSADPPEGSFGQNAEKPMAQSLYSFVRDLSDKHKKNVDLVTFGWSGALSADDRKSAGRVLAEELERYRNNSEITEVWTIAHSHGCNVVYNASVKAAKADIKLIDFAIQIASPSMDTDEKHPTYVNFGKIYHFYSTGDFTQVLGSFEQDMKELMAVMYGVLGTMASEYYDAAVIMMSNTWNYWFSGGANAQQDAIQDQSVVVNAEDGTDRIQWGQKYYERKLRHAPDTKHVYNIRTQYDAKEPSHNEIKQVVVGYLKDVLAKLTVYDNHFYDLDMHVDTQKEESRVLAAIRHEKTASDGDHAEANEASKLDVKAYQTKYGHAISKKKATFVGMTAYEVLTMIKLLPKKKII